ncbi:MAG: Rab family GTPase [Candidatus Thorarchaeota archaeon]
MTGSENNNVPLRKVILVGSGAVGKTTLATRLITGAYVETMMTVGLNVDTWTVEDSTKKASIKIVSFDLGGQEQFRFFQQDLVKGAQFAIIVFDVSRYESFLELEEWMKFVQDIPENCRVLVANKADIPSIVSEEDIQEFSKKYNLPVIQTSCVTGEGIKELENILWESLKGNGVCGNT